MKIARPVKYDKDNQIVIDANGKTICLLSWPNCGKTPETIDDQGIEIKDSLNRIDVVSNIVDKRPRGNPNWIKRKNNDQWRGE